MIHVLVQQMVEKVRSKRKLLFSFNVLLKTKSSLKAFSDLSQSYSLVESVASSSFYLLQTPRGDFLGLVPCYHLVYMAYHVVLSFTDKVNSLGVGLVS